MSFFFLRQKKHASDEALERMRADLEEIRCNLSTGCVFSRLEEIYLLREKFPKEWHALGPEVEELHCAVSRHLHLLNEEIAKAMSSHGRDPERTKLIRTLDGEYARVARIIPTLRKWLRNTGRSENIEFFTNEEEGVVDEKM